METKHTPGPWVVNVNAAGDLDVSPDGGDMICDLQKCNNAEANARLIAAAPDLLLALQAIAAIGDKRPYNLHEVQIQRYSQGSIDIARAAIAKATGGE